MSSLLQLRDARKYAGTRQPAVICRDVLHVCRHLGRHIFACNGHRAFLVGVSLFRLRPADANSRWCDGRHNCISHQRHQLDHDRSTSVYRFDHDRVWIYACSGAITRSPLGQAWEAAALCTFRVRTAVDSSLLVDCRHDALVCGRKCDDCGDGILSAIGSRHLSSHILYPLSRRFLLAIASWHRTDRFIRSRPWRSQLLSGDCGSN